jgi:hypothetical protein
VTRSNSNGKKIRQPFARPDRRENFFTVQYMVLSRSQTSRKTARAQAETFHPLLFKLDWLSILYPRHGSD